MTATAMHGEPRGFTLVELLVGMAVSMLIVVVAASSYLAATGAWTKSRSQTTRTQYARAALDRMAQCLRGVVPPDDDAGADFYGESALIEGTELEADALRFTTTAIRVLPDRPRSTDLRQVEFYLNIDEELGEPVLMLREKPFPVDDENFPGTTAELAPNVVSFGVEYYDGIEYVPDWSGSSLPESVRITLFLVDFESNANPVMFTKIVSLRRRG